MPFLSQVLGRPVLDPDGSRVGTLRDLLVSSDSPYPPVRAAVIGNSHQQVVPWREVASVTPRGTALRRPFDRRRYPESASDELIWLGRDVMDKQIVDTHGVKLVRVNDVALTPLNDELRLAGVDNSSAGLLRRLGLGWLARPGRSRLIDWEQVDIGPAVDEVRLKVPFERLQRMHPADIAEVVSQMSPGQAADVLEALDDQTAARAMAELPDEHQAAVLSAMEPDEAADVLEQMRPDDAADVLGDVEEERAEELMSLMAPQAARDVRSLLRYAEDTAGGRMDSNIITILGEATADDVINQLRRTAPPEEEIYYLYVVDAEGRLRGVLSLRNLIIAPPTAPVADIMRRDVESVRLDDPEEEVARKLVRYDLLAVPVVDEEDRLKGVVTVDDVVDLVMPRRWRSRQRRMLT